MPKREPESTEPLTTAELQAFVMRLNDVAAELEQCRAALTDDDSVIYVFKTKSMRLGLDRIEAFAAEARKSRLAIIEGHPYGPETSKRQENSAKKAAPALAKMRRASEMASEDDDAIAEELDRVAKRGATKKKATAPPAKGGRKRKSG